MHSNGSILYQSVQFLAYAYDIDIIRRTMRDVTNAAFGAIERESAIMGMAVNEGKTKYMMMTSGVVPRMPQITANSHNFGVFKEFIYLGTAINTSNDVSLEIKRRITVANRCYFGLNRQLSSRDLSRTMKLTLYQVLILPVLLYGAET